MCGGKRRAHQAPGFGFSPAVAPFGHQAHGCHHQRGCGPRCYRGGRCGHQPYHHNNAGPLGGGGPIGAAVGAIGAIAKAVDSRQTSKEQIAGHINGGPRSMGGEQTTGIANTNMDQLPPVYPEAGNVPKYNEKELAASMDRIDEPPAYTPHASPREANVAVPAQPPAPYGVSIPAQPPAPSQPHAPYGRSVPAQPPVSSQIRDVNTSFAALPILQQNQTQAVSQDITNLNNAIASMSLGERGSRCAAKRAKKQLVRDLWDAEKTRYGAMGCAERKELKAQIKGVKHALRAEIRGY